MKTNRFGLTQEQVMENRALMKSLPRIEPKKKVLPPKKNTQTRSGKYHLTKLQQKVLDIIIDYEYIAMPKISALVEKPNDSGRKAAMSLIKKNLVEYDKKTKIYSLADGVE